MNVTLNCKNISVFNNTKLLELLKAQGYNLKVAIWINGRQLLTRDYEAYVIKENDNIKVIRILGGG